MPLEKFKAPEGFTPREASSPPEPGVYLCEITKADSTYDGNGVYVFFRALDGKQKVGGFGRAYRLTQEAVHETAKKRGDDKTIDEMVQQAEVEATEFYSMADRAGLDVSGEFEPADLVGRKLKVGFERHGFIGRNSGRWETLIRIPNGGYWHQKTKDEDIDWEPVEPKAPASQGMV